METTVLYDNPTESLVYNRASNDGESSDSMLNSTLSKEKSKKSNFANVAWNVFRRIKYGLKIIKDTVLYGIYIFKSWMSYTFCYIVGKQKKTPGIIRSVRV